MNDTFTKSLTTLLPQVITLRRDLHAHPETAFNEHRTAAKVAEWLKRLPNIKIRTGVAGTGIVADIGADRPGPCLALRADMDALPMDDLCGKPHASTIPGFCHACGHDGHTACLAGAATLLTAFPERAVGPIRLIFQPAEEKIGGAQRMIQEGALADPQPKAIFGLHCFPQLALGTVGALAGPALASTDTINITIKGRSTHAAMPHKGIDPIFVAAHTITALQGYVARMRPPFEPTLLTIGNLHAGTTHNIIPDTATMNGTLRAYSQEDRDAAKGAIRQIATHTAAAFGATAEVEIDEGYPVTFNNPDLTTYALNTARQALGPDNATTNVARGMGGEDFSYYAQKIPGCFIRLGTTPRDVTDPVTVHNSAFDFNDDALATGITLLCALVWSWPGTTPTSDPA